MEEQNQLQQSAQKKNRIANWLYISIIAVPLLLFISLPLMYRSGMQADSAQLTFIFVFTPVAILLMFLLVLIASIIKSFNVTNKKTKIGFIIASVIILIIIIGGINLLFSFFNPGATSGTKYIESNEDYQKKLELRNERLAESTSIYLKNFKKENEQWVFESGDLKIVFPKEFKMVRGYYYPYKEALAFINQDDAVVEFMIHPQKDDKPSSIENYLESDYKTTSPNLYSHEKNGIRYYTQLPPNGTGYKAFLPITENHQPTQSFVELDANFYIPPAKKDLVYDDQYDKENWIKLKKATDQILAGISYK